MSIIDTGFTIKECEKGLLVLQKAMRKVDEKYPHLTLLLEARLKELQQPFYIKVMKHLKSFTTYLLLAISGVLIAAIMLGVLEGIIFIIEQLT